MANCIVDAFLVFTIILMEKKCEKIGRKLGDVIMI